MPGSRTNAIADWRAKDMRARLAEEEMRVAWNAYFEWRGPPPSPDLLAHAQKLRRSADEALARAIEARRAAGRAPPR